MKKNKNIRPLNNKGQRHGLWVWYWSNGYLMYKSLFHNDKEIGYEEIYLSPYSKLDNKIYNI